jgi:hypothetical protein
LLFDVSVLAAQLSNQTRCNTIDSHKGGIDQQPPQILVSHAATKMSMQQQEGNASLASTQPQKNTQLVDKRDTANPPNEHAATEKNDQQPP